MPNAIEQFRLQKAAEQEQANAYNTLAAQTYRENPSLVGNDVQDLTMGFVPWNDHGSEGTPTFQKQPYDKAIASLQNDKRFINLSDDLQEYVLNARGGAEAIRQHRLSKVINALSQKRQAANLEELDKRKMDLQLAPMMRIKDMFNKGDLRVNPKGEGFQLKGKNLAGMEEWQDADLRTTRDAINTWGLMYPGQRPPVNAKLLESLAALRAGQGQAQPQPKTLQEKATAYNTGVANLQHSPVSAVGAGQEARRIFESLFAPAPDATFQGQSVLGKSLNYMSAMPVSGVANLGQTLIQKPINNLVNAASGFFGGGKIVDSPPAWRPEDVEPYLPIGLIERGMEALRSSPTPTVPSNPYLNNKRIGY